MTDDTRLDDTVVVTGVGVVSAAGSSMAAVTASLDRRRHCLRPIEGFETTGLAATHGGEVVDFAPLDFLPPSRVSTLDRGTQMALHAARQALAQAGLDQAATTACGVAVGTSGSPQFQNMRVFPDRAHPVSRLAALYAARTTPNFQADQLARAYGLGGPRFAFGSASLGGMLALSHAMDLLRAGHAPAMLVGGGEINTMLNALGMDGLGMTAPGPCTPFAGRGGICFGDGAAAFVLETAASAERRGARPLAELLAVGISADAYSDVAQDPSGQGLARALRKCLQQAGLDPARIGWIRSCGTGQRELDNAEAMALCAVFDDAPPPVTSTEPYFSHVNGVSPLLGLAGVLVALATDRAISLPDLRAPVADAASPRPAMRSLTLLPPGPLPAGDCLVTATAFGGTNAALAVRRMAPAYPRRSRARLSPRRHAAERIVIAGMGAVSPLGGTVAELLQGLERDAAGRSGELARRVDEAALRQRRPGLELQRRERLVRMAMLAVHEALSGQAVRGSERFGLLVGLSRGPVAAYERLFEHTLRGRFDITTGRALLRIGRFSVASELAHSFGLLGYSGAMAPGVHGGVQLLAHGAELLRSHRDLDGLLVVAADEWTRLQQDLYQRLGLLGDGAAYAPDASGCIGGEGAAAVLLCRRENIAVGDWAVIAGTGFAGDTGIRADPHAVAYQRAIGSAIDRAGLAPPAIEFAVGQGCGWPAHDRRELAGLRPVCPAAPLASVLPHTGVAESAGGLFAAMAAAARLRRARAGLLIGSSERGAHAAVVLTRAAA